MIKIVRKYATLALDPRVQGAGMRAFAELGTQLGTQLGNNSTL